MPRERLYLFDTTLRDGAQTNGVDFTLADKLAIAGLLDDLGVDYVEAGYPGANPTDTNFFAQRRKLRAKVTAFGMTRRPGRSTSNDPGLAAMLEAEADAKCCSTASIFSMVIRRNPLMHWPAPRPPTMKARAGSCSATPTGARCRTK
jgi:isopropylmalate/homocitrate/citramalate synthase